MNLDRWNLSRRDDARTATAERDTTERPTVVRDRATTRATGTTRTTGTTGTTGTATAATTVLDRRAVVARQREAFGGVKVGSAFFGWLAATGTAVLLTALIAAGGTALGVLSGRAATHPDFGVTWRGTRGAAMIVLVLLVAYFCGGYVAGRMARFNGLKQGLAVFAWAVLVMLVVAALGAVAGTQWDALNAVTGLPKFSTGPTRVTPDGLLVGLLAGVAALVGAAAGGMAGMRFHRRVDRAGLGA
jgi:hypothetical protein